MTDADAEDLKIALRVILGGLVELSEVVTGLTGVPEEPAARLHQWQAEARAWLEHLQPAPAESDSD